MGLSGRFCRDSHLKKYAEPPFPRRQESSILEKDKSVHRILQDICLLRCGREVSRCIFGCIIIINTIVLLFCPPVAVAKTDIFSRVSAEFSIPMELLYGVALVETGQSHLRGQYEPWPWSLNVEGQSFYYPTRELAWKALTSYIGLGIKNIDVGLMQINWFYHHERLHDPWQVLDPYFNLQTSAKILSDAFAKEQNWIKAAGRYHAPSAPKRAGKYQNKLLQKLAWLQRYN